MDVQLLRRRRTKTSPKRSTKTTHSFAKATQSFDVVFNCSTLKTRRES